MKHTFPSCTHDRLRWQIMFNKTNAEDLKSLPSYHNMSEYGFKVVKYNCSYKFYMFPNVFKNLHAVWDTGWDQNSSYTASNGYFDEVSTDCYQGQIQDLKLGGVPLFEAGDLGAAMRPPRGSRAKPWWGPRRRSPQELLNYIDFIGLKTCLQRISYFYYIMDKRTRYGCVHKQAQKFSWSKIWLDKSLICVIGK
jgi:hypothetical protein